jgi:hypothetical protein
MNSLGVSDRLRKGGEHQICLSLAYYLSFVRNLARYITEIHIFMIMTTFQLMVGVISFWLIHQFNSSILYRWAANFSEIMWRIDSAFHDQTGIYMHGQTALGSILPSISVLRRKRLGSDEKELRFKSPKSGGKSRRSRISLDESKS